MLTWKVNRDAEGKYYLDFYENGEMLFTNREGEIGLTFQNEDRSITETLAGWKGSTCTEGENQVTLAGAYESAALTGMFFVKVTYLRVNDRVIKKTTQVQQSNLSMVFFSQESRLTPAAGACSHLWSFDDFDCRGGIIHGTYPAAGFITRRQTAVGILTDAGHRNLWTRNVRRRPNPGMHGFTAIRKMCDPELYTASSAGVCLKLGDMRDYTLGSMCEETVLDHLCVPGRAEKQLALQDGYYTLRLAYESTAPISLRFLRADGETTAFHYQDGLEAGRRTFSDDFFLADTQGRETTLAVATADGSEAVITQGTLVRHAGVSQPYHPLRMGKTEERNLFLFAAPGNSLRDVRILSQTCLADGLGFEGGLTEKILYADMQMLTWITSHADFTPLNVPSINYAPDMYARDSFWSAAGVNDKALSLALFDRWGDTQAPSGGIGTIVTPCMGSVEVKGNEATCEWLWWALLNRQKYGAALPENKIRAAFAYCVAEFDPQKTGVCQAHYVLGQNDVTTYPGELKTSALSVNQGVWAVTLRVAKALGLEVAEDWIGRAEENYRSFYDPWLGYVVNDKNYPGAISFGDLMPEFASLWLLGRPILTDEMVTGTLEHIPRTGPCGFMIGHAQKRYFTDTDKPYDAHYTWPDGIYYNGASWMREEMMGYACGKLHGWSKAEKAMTDRLAAEINWKESEPFSHEFLPTDLSQPGCWWPSTRVFCWNVFALTAMALAGLRKE